MRRGRKGDCECGRLSPSYVIFGENSFDAHQTHFPSLYAGRDKTDQSGEVDLEVHEARFEVQTESC